MSYIAEWNVRHDGKKFKIGEEVTGLKKPDIDRLVTLGAIIDPEAEQKAIQKAAAKKSEQEVTE